MFSYLLNLVALLVIACLLQPFLPIITGWYDARFLILPLVVLCGSATVSTATMLILAFAGGFLWDAQQILVFEHGDPIVYREDNDSLRFGYSIILYALMGFLMQGVRPLFRQGHWYLPAFLSGIAIFLYLFVEYLLRSFLVGGFVLDNGIIEQIAATAILTMVLSPFVFWLLFRLAALCRYKIYLPKKRRAF